MSTAPRRQPALKPDRIDPITISVIQGALENIAIEMGYKLMRMSYSSIIRESERISGRLWSTPRAAGSPNRRSRRRCNRARSRAMCAAC
jgi:Hydantoinase B/oxoprolinase